VAAETNRDQKMTALAEGWLDTGDLGELSPDGYLTLNGRKKDLIVTAYGLKISPTPIEARLRCIPGVAEVMLVGDRRPYFTALFWPEDHGKSPGFIQAVEEGLRALNGWRGVSRSNAGRYWQKTLPYRMGA
jgi:long-subunit acyl-CoA synthetase (AMP-forming)